MEVGLYGGGSFYMGDLNPSLPFLNTQIAYGLLGRLNIDTRWSVKLSAYRGKIKGSSVSSGYLPDRNLSFVSNLTDVSAEAEFNFMEYFTGSQKSGISPYIYAGISVFFFDPMANGISLRSLGTEGQQIGYLGRSPYNTVSVSVPFGVGGKFSLAKNLGLTVFWEMHKTFTDYLDDVSTTYYLNGQLIDPNNPVQVLSDPSMNHKPGMQRGNSKNNDWYSFAGVTLTYKFRLHGTRKCRDTKFK